MDFSRCALSGRYYGGSEKKLGIIMSGAEYMLKFQKETAFGFRNNHFSEYIGSHMFAAMGFSAQETYLGYYKKRQVVACRDFNVQGAQFVPFNDVGESTLDQDKELYQYEYEDIMQMLRDNSKLTDVEETVTAFWRTYIVDALLGNFDRHGGNWGFIRRNNKYSLAPVFDNGSCLFPNLTDEEEMLRIIDSEDETDRRVFTFPTSQIRLRGRKSSYYEVINSLEFPECSRALDYVYEKLDMEKIVKIVDETPMLSEMQRRFYKHMLWARYKKILEAPYLKMKAKEGKRWDNDERDQDNGHDMR